MYQATPLLLYQDFYPTGLLSIHLSKYISVRLKNGKDLFFCCKRDLCICAETCKIPPHVRPTELFRQTTTKTVDEFEGYDTTM